MKDVADEKSIELQPGSTILEKRPARRKGQLGEGKQLELLRASELIHDDPAGPHNGYLSYMANILVRLTMPHRPFKDEHGRPAFVFTREYNGLSITIQANPKVGLPTGSIPRLLMSFITSEAVRTKQSEIQLGRSLNGFLRKLGYASSSGGVRGTATAVKSQLQRLFAANISIIDSREDAFGIANINVAKRALLWWDQKHPDQLGLFNSTVELSKDFFHEIIKNPVPLDMRALTALSHSPMALDLYAYSTWRMSFLRRRELVDWRALQAQFGANYPQTAEGLRDFRTAFRAQWKAVSAVYPEARIDVSDAKHVVLLPSPTHVPMLPVDREIGRLAKGLKSSA